MSTNPGKPEPMDDYSTRYRTHVLFGMPGSGKGTQGAVLGQLPDLIHISMGEIFRKIPKSGASAARLNSIPPRAGWFPMS